MDEALHALSEPHRRQILELVRGEERSAGEIAACFDITRPAISQHLRVLKDAGLLIERRAGARRLYRARTEGLTELRSWLTGMWDDGLARLQHVAEAEQRQRDDASNTELEQL